MSLLEKQPGRSARLRHLRPAAPEPEVPETRPIIANSFSVCLYCRGGVPVQVENASIHVTKDGKQFACSDRPVVRPGGGW